MNIDIQVISSKLQPVRKDSPPDTELTLAAVLIPLFKKHGIYHILFTRRTEKVRHHKGQISFPGGKYDPEDISLHQTALRETHEEVGIQRHDLQILGQMPDMPTMNHFLIRPFIGVFPHPYEYRISRDEIDFLIEVPLTHLMDTRHFTMKQKEFQGQHVNICYYFYKEHTIWGITGQILNDFITRLQRIL